jgi:hypothetical protein
VGSSTSSFFLDPKIPASADSKTSRGEKKYQIKTTNQNQNKSKQNKKTQNKTTKQQNTKQQNHKKNKKKTLEPSDGFYQGGAILRSCRLPAGNRSSERNNQDRISLRQTYEPRLG